MRNKIILALLLMAFGLNTIAQSVTTTRDEQKRLAHHNPEMVSCVYRAYPGPNSTDYNQPPKGYKPVFISHYGRHGSRFLTEDERYTWLIKEMEAHKLTDNGKELLERVRIAWKQAEGRGGDLTTLGEEQHKQIAERMFMNYTTLFKGAPVMKVFSSTSRRCMMSMMAFCEQLKELNPRLNIERDVCEKNMRFISYASDEQKKLCKEAGDETTKAYNAFKAKTARTTGFMERIFVNPKEIKDAYYFMEQMYFLAQDMQDCGQPTEMLSFFTTDELYSVWQIKNVEMYLRHADAPMSRGIPAQCADSLMNHFIVDADSALAEGRMGATLRFGHDTVLLKLLAIMRIKECCPATNDMDNLSLVWQDFNNSPMAGNLQLVFYQNNDGNTLVRFLLNENEVHLDLQAVHEVYYDWEEVKKYWKNGKK